MNRNFFVAFAMAILLRRSIHFTLYIYDGYLKILYLLKRFGLFKKEGGGSHSLTVKVHSL